MNNENYKIPIPLGCSKNAIIYQRLSSTQPNQYNLGKDSLECQKKIFSHAFCMKITSFVIFMEFTKSETWI